jgi:hypothetical protein
VYEQLAALAIVPNEIANIFAGIRVLAAANTLIEPFCHGLGNGNSHGCHAQSPDNQQYKPIFMALPKVEVAFPFDRWDRYADGGIPIGAHSDRRYTSAIVRLDGGGMQQRMRQGTQSWAPG